MDDEFAQRWDGGQLRKPVIPGKSFDRVVLGTHGEALQFGMLAQGRHALGRYGDIVKGETPPVLHASQRQFGGLAHMGAAKAHFRNVGGDERFPAAAGEIAHRNLFEALLPTLARPATIPRARAAETEQKAISCYEVGQA